MLGTNACGHTTRPRCLWGDLLKEPVGDEPHGFLTGLPEKGTARSRLRAARFVAPVEASLVLLARAWSWNLHPQGWMASNDYGSLLPERYLWEQMLGEKQFRAASSTFQDSLLSTALITHTHTLACTANFLQSQCAPGQSIPSQLPLSEGSALRQGLPRPPARPPDQRLERQQKKSEGKLGKASVWVIKPTVKEGYF